MYTVMIEGGPGGVTDASGNPLLNSYSWSFTTASAATCPCSFWSSTRTPTTTAYGADSNPYELGVKFRTDVDGFITGVRFYKGAGNTGSHLGHLWTASGTMLGEARFIAESATGWQQVNFPTPIAVKANTTYVASYYDPVGRYALDRPFFTTGVDTGVLHALADGSDGGNGVLKAGASGFPTKSTQQSNYWVDVVFSTEGADRQPPSVVSVTPAGGSGGVVLTQVAQAQFDEALAAGSVGPGTVELRSLSGSIPAAASFDPGTKQLSVSPAASLLPGTTYTVVIHGGPGGVTDAAGNSLPADYSWSFTTYSCPCSIWANSRLPSNPAVADGTAYELGVKFRSDIDGYVGAIRFYKGTSNTGMHVGHLWSPTTGLMLGEVIFASETASGWQQASFASPIPIKADTTYIVSYYAPNGHYALDRPYFTRTFDNRLLHALGDGLDGGNGVFAGPGVSAFPAKSTQQSNYWVDLVFTATP
jgi:hypothetical protein